MGEQAGLASCTETTLYGATSSCTCLYGLYHTVQEAKGRALV